MDSVALPMPAEQPKAPLLDWRVFAVLVVMNIVASILLVPYANSLSVSAAGGIPNGNMSPTTMLAVLAVAQFACSVVVNAPLAAIGLIIARRIELGAPILERLVRGQPIDASLWRGALIGFGLGFVAGPLLFGLIFLMEPIVGAELAAHNIQFPDDLIPPAWMGFLASISAGVTEETLVRLFGLSLVAWIISAITGRHTGRPATAALWIANLVTALVFGAMHLPNMLMLGPLTPMMTVQIFLANGLIGLLFGWLYWKYGLESAMLAHFSVDIVLHVIPPLFGFA